jgi:curved DNA-binding protein CbpA
MTNPLEVLGLTYGVDAETSRRRYLELVRQFPPERAPERFAEIRAAYDRLRDPVVNLESRLFSLTASQSFENLVAQTRPDVRGRRIASEVLLSLARS